MGVFNNGKLCDILSGEEVFIYNILLGELQNSGFYDGGDGGIISSDGKPQINVDIKDNIPNVNIDIQVKMYGVKNLEESTAVLKTRCEDFLNRIKGCGSDILGFGRYVKKDFLTQKEWENYNWKDKYRNSTFSVNLVVKNVKN